MPVHPSTPARLDVWRHSWRRRIVMAGTFAGCVALATGLATLLMIARPLSIGLAAVLSLTAWIIGLIAWVLWRETRAMWRLSITLEDSRVVLRLPTRRGFASLPPIDEALDLAAIAGVETRVEIFSQLMVGFQRAWALRLRDGRCRLLGADRDGMTERIGPAARAIADAAGVPVTDRGSIDGRPGVMLAWGATVPDWDAPALDAPTVGRRLASAERAWAVVALLMTLAMVAGLIARWSE